MTVISRHRLPRFYRLALTVLWLLPLAMLGGALLLAHGLPPLLDVRLLAPLLLMALPALYIWQEGVDVLDNGIRARVHLPRFYPYEHLDNWYFDSRPQRRVLTIWSARGKVLECRAGHLTDVPTLLRELKARVRYRGFPY
ncbi:MAG: hypothetical protein U0694_02405 [Anaerolineae bacterium]